MVGLTNDNISDANKPVSSTLAALNLKANLSPTFTGTVSGITKAMVLTNVDNISDANKPITIN
jgi:hypothetical protein